MNAGNTAPGIIIVGAGQAGVQAAEALRAGGYEGSITLLGDEPHGPYHRPPLSKAWLAGEMDAAQLVMRAPEMLARKGIDLRTGVTVQRIDRAAKALQLADGSLLRLESVQNATEQGKSAAAALLGQDRPFTATPWFWSDQFDRKLQMAGLSMGADAWAVRGDMAGGGFSVYHFQGERLLAVDSVNAAKDHLQARKLLDAGVSPTPAQAADLSFDLGSLLPR
jgi:NADPH-dependent 2,4-dienoyl-CoA reductase/sulfur reductase-like enzyme